MPTSAQAEIFRKSVQLIGASEKAEYEEAGVELENEEQVYQAALAAAPSSVRLYIWINKNLTNPLMV